MSISICGRLLRPWRRALFISSLPPAIGLSTRMLGTSRAERHFFSTLTLSALRSIERLRHLSTSSTSSFGKRPREGSWLALPPDKRIAWEVLGWSEESWSGEKVAPLSSWTPWNDLLPAQKAAAQHGIGLTPESWARLYEDRSWDTEAGAAPITEADSHGQSGGGNVPASGRTSSAMSKSQNLSEVTPEKNASGGALARAAWTVAKVVAPVAGEVLAKTKHPLLSFIGQTLARSADITDSISGQITVEGVETTLYLDDSGSMGMPFHSGDVFSGTYLDQGQAVLQSLAPMLRGPTRILKFGREPRVLVPREEMHGGLEGSQDSSSVKGHITDGKSPIQQRKQSSMNSLIRSTVGAAWKGESGSTYMWKMIEEDVIARYKPGPGKLRLIVITDGSDTDSPGNYCGIGGMSPLMQELQKQGYDIEWHIIVLGDVDGSGRYAALAGATGGSFLELKESFDAEKGPSKRLLEAVGNGGGDDAKARHSRQQKYLMDARAGRAKRFDWTKALPPPK